MIKINSAYRLILITLVILIAAGCTEKAPKKWGPGSRLRVGTDATYPPFEMVNVETGKPEGFDIDIIKAICEMNEWKYEFVITPFDGIIPGLKGDKYDCIISAMTITPQRQAIVSFSDPYYHAGQIIAVPVDDTTIASVEDLRGMNIGVQLGTTGERMAKSLTGLSVFSYDNIGAAFIDMENGRIDAVLNDYPTTMEYIRLKGKAKTVGNLLSEENYGIAVRKNDDILLAKINSALEKLRERGFFDKLMSRWLSSDLTKSSPDSAESP